VIPEAIFRPLLEAASPLTDPGSTPSIQILSALVNLFGEIHRSHVGLVRDELEQIRSISREMAQIQRGLTVKRHQSGPASLDDENDKPTVFSEEPLDDSVHDPPEGRPSPKDVQELVNQRLAAWERERKTHWRKVVELLVKQ
jgi:hypothetical protein